MPTSFAVAGKGGTGKSTIAALLVTALVRRGRTPVLAIDADPDSNLAALLGAAGESSVADLREDVRAEMKNFAPGMSKAHYVEAGLHQVIAEGEGFDLITMGRGEGAGCYCYLNSLIKKFCDDLVPSYRSVVMDNEAGLEHISRRTSTSVDALITVVTDNPLSFACAEKIAAVSAGIKGRIFKSYIVSSMLKPGRLEKIRERISALPMEYLGDIPYDDTLEQAVFDGKPLTSIDDKTDVMQSIYGIVDRIGGSDGNS